MNQLGIIVVGILTVAALCFSYAGSVPIIFCQPGAPSEGPTKDRQLCIALLGRMDVSEEAVQNDPNFVARGTKRQDIDHVFLRFGRRLLDY